VPGKKTLPGEVGDNSSEKKKVLKESLTQTSGGTVRPPSNQGSERSLHQTERMAENKRPGKAVERLKEKKKEIGHSLKGKKGTITKKKRKKSGGKRGNCQQS